MTDRSRLKGRAMTAIKLQEDLWLALRDLEREAERILGEDDTLVGLDDLDSIVAEAAIDFDADRVVDYILDSLED